VDRPGLHAGPLVADFCPWRWRSLARDCGYHYLHPPTRLADIRGRIISNQKGAAALLAVRADSGDPVLPIQGAAIG